MCLPPRRDHPVNTQCVVIGWGRVEGGKDATHLREKTVTKAVERRTGGHEASDEGMYYEVDEPTTCFGDSGEVRRRRHAFEMAIFVCVKTFFLCTTSIYHHH